MRRFILPLLLALIGVFGAGSLAPVLPRVHAQIATPTVSIAHNPVQVGETVAVTGQNFGPNSWAYVTFRRPDGTTNALYVATSPYGTFSLGLGFASAHGTGTELLTAYDIPTGRQAPTITIVVTSGTPAAVRRLNVSSLAATPGSTITISGLGFSRNNWVYVYFQRPDGTVGAFWVQTDAAGAFTSQLGFAAAHGLGVETIWAYDLGSGLWSAPRTVTVTTGAPALAAPSNLRVLASTVDKTSALQTTVLLQWQDNSSAETGFRIRTTLTRMFGAVSTQIVETGPNATTAQVSYVAGGINPLQTACFTVTAFNAGGESAPSNQVCL
jgi:hypothetical protein